MTKHNFGILNGLGVLFALALTVGSCSGASSSGATPAGQAQGKPTFIFLFTSP